MILRQRIRFWAQSETLLEYVLRGLSKIASLDEVREVFLFSNYSGSKSFKLKCAIVEGGIDVSSSGDYFGFLGALVETLAREFGPISIEWAESENSVIQFAAG